MGHGSRRARRAFALVAVAAAVAVPTALGGAAESVEAIYTAPDIGGDLMVDETPAAWFVQLSSSPATFRANAKAAGLNIDQRFEYSKLWQGVSVAADPKAIGVITRLPGVEAVYPVVSFEIPETGAISPDLATAIAMTGADKAQSELGYTGAGVKVAIMDTGVDYDHSDLGGDGTQRTNSSVFPTARVTHGYDFVGDAYNANPADPAYNPTPSPDAYPDDCNGHGTHVAGIVGANGEATGVAPDVTFGAYRVFGCAGSTTADIMLAAMERALDDGMDVLNMSIGSAFMTWPQYPTAVGSDALVDAGMVVVASIGNSGANGVYSAGAPGVGNKVIGVASFDNSHVSALSFDAPGRSGIAYLPIASTEDPPTSGTTPDVVWVGRGCNSDAYLGDPSGKVALIERGVCTFAEKYNKAVAAGAVDVIIHNNVPGLFAGGGVVGVAGISAVGISQADGLYLRGLTGPFGVTWTSNRVNAANPSGGRASSFTSFGLTAELKLKPNLGAPGGLIRSTWPLENGAYAILSGTSMSSPHVAGAVALLLQAKPGTSAADVKTLFQNSADPVAFPTTTAFRDVVHRQGAGMLDVDDSILATTTVTPSEISVGEGTGTTTTLTITNNGSSTETYTLGSTSALSTFGSTNAPSFTTTGGGATVSPSSLTLGPGTSGTASVAIAVGDFTGFNLQYGGWINVASSSGKTYRVPYAGLSGDYQAIQVLTPTSFGFPWLAKLAGGSFSKQSDGAVYTTKGGDVPYFLLHFEHQARRIEMTLLDAATGEPFTGSGALRRNPTFFVQDYLPRNSTATAFSAFAWDGTLKRAVLGKPGDVVNPVPEGSYKVKVSVLKALGDASNPAHWETWTSPSFTIDRP